jgi:Ca2+-transporting ATPase
VFSRGLGWGIAWIGSLLGALLLISADIGWSQGYSHWQSVAFSALLLSRVGLVLTMRSEQDSCLQLNPNPALAIAVPVTCSLHLLILTLPWLRSLFQVDLLSGREILWCIAVGLIMMACVEVEKRLKRKS